MLNPKVKPGDTILVTKMVDPYRNYSGHKLIVKHIDDAGGIWCEGCSVSILPDVDEYQLVNSTNDEKE